MPRSKKPTQQGDPEILPKVQLRVTLTQTIRDIDRDNIQGHPAVASVLDSHPGTHVKDVLGLRAKPKRIEMKYINRREYDKKAKLEARDSLQRQFELLSEELRERNRRDVAQRFKNLMNSTQMRLIKTVTDSAIKRSFINIFLEEKIGVPHTAYTQVRDHAVEDFFANTSNEALDRMRIKRGDKRFFISGRGPMGQNFGDSLCVDYTAARGILEAWIKNEVKCGNDPDLFNRIFFSIYNEDIVAKASTRDIMKRFENMQIR